MAFYVRVYCFIPWHQIHSQQRAVQSSDAGNLKLARLQRSTIMCYFPVYVSWTLHEPSIKDWQTDWQFAIIALFMNSSINNTLLHVLLAFARALRGSESRATKADVVWTIRRKLDKILFERKEL